MARIYDVVCPNCGEVWSWCKYDEPIIECDNCCYVMAQKRRDGNQNYTFEWKAEVKVFGVGSCSEDVKEYSKPIKDFYVKRFDGVFQNPSHRRGKI